MNSFEILKNKKLLIFYFSVFLSNIGSWLQNVALSWLALSIKNASFSFGLISFLNSIPSLFFAFIGGYLADYFNNRRILVVSQSVCLLVAFYLGISVYTNKISYIELATLAFISGVGSAISYPIYYNILISFVSHDKIPALIALNSLQFNLSRFIGPTVFSLLVLITGIGGAFILNGLSYLPFIFVLLTIVFSEKLKSRDNRNFFTNILSGFKYIVCERKLFDVIKIVLVYSFFVLPYMGMLPYYIKNYVGDNPQLLGIELGILGFGSILGSIFITLFPENYEKLFERILKSGCSFSILLGLLGVVTNIYFFSLTIFLMGFSMVLFYASANAFIHLISKEDFRGRVASIFTSVYLGVYPVGVLITGTIAEYISIKLIFIAQATFSIFYVILIFVNYKFRLY